MDKRFVLLDRDGTIVVERNYLSHPDQVELIPGVAEGLKRLAQLGLGLLVVTNQSGIARGYFDEVRLAQIHRRMCDMLAAHGVRLDGIYVCPHMPEDDCGCRKPRAGLVATAAAELGFDPTDSFIVGDKPCDIELGRRVGASHFPGSDGLRHSARERENSSSGLRGGRRSRGGAYHRTDYFRGIGH